jgi:hypothetical protein
MVADVKADALTWRDLLSLCYLPRIIPKAELTLIMTEASVPDIPRASNLPLNSKPND